MKSAPILTTIFIISVFEIGSTQKCHMRELNNCIEPVMKYIREPWNAIPSNIAEVRRECTDIREMIQCFTNYTRKCMSLAQKQLMGSIMKMPIQKVERYCNEENEFTSAVIQNSDCLKEVVASPEMHTCISDVQASIDAMVDFTEDPDVLACCAYNRFRSCQDEAIERNCGNEAVGLSDIVLRVSLYHIADSLCKCTVSSDCVSVLPPSGTIPLGIYSGSALSELLQEFLPVT